MRTISFVIGSLFAHNLTAQSPSAAAPLSCERLRTLAVPHTQITLAQPVAAGTFTPPPRPASLPEMRADYSRLPAFCRVAATISPVPGSTIKMEVWLPAQGWNGKFVGVGNGGFSGEIWYFAMAEPLARGYAVAGTDTGHEGGPADASFGLHPEQLADHAWRAVHEMTVKSKAIAAAHYGRGARYAYWIGCSSGGRQGLKEAQRFAADYDGISAGAPANNWVPLMAHATRVQHVMTDPATRFTPAQLALLKDAAIAACDARDGVTDRVVEDPAGCAFDPGTLQCTAETATNCLSPRQVEAVRSVYAGVVNPRTGETIMPGPTPGGENSWIVFTPDIFPIGTAYFRDLVMRDRNWDISTLDFDRDIARGLAQDQAELTTMEADLREFFARGGKLLLWHGWTDGMIPARNTIDYYQRALTASGPAASSSMRLFMMPGVDHCSGGEGTFMMDALGTIDAWVESGQAPERIVASRPLGGDAQRTRPLCAWPQIARYRGQGSTDDERNFECAARAR